MSEKIALKNCPFCGSNDIERRGRGIYAAVQTYQRICLRCGVSTKEVFSTQEADAQWNARPSAWIPVSERLPEKEDEYLVTIIGQTRRCRFYLDDDGEGGFASPSVTAWQPLPEPYQPEGK